MLRSMSSASQRSALPPGLNSTAASCVGVAEWSSGTRDTGKAKRQPLLSSSTTRMARRSYRAERARSPATRSRASRARAARISSAIVGRRVALGRMESASAVVQVLEVHLDNCRRASNVAIRHAEHGSDGSAPMSAPQLDHDLAVTMDHMHVRRRVFAGRKEDGQPNAGDAQYGWHRNSNRTDGFSPSSSGDTLRFATARSHPYHSMTICTNRPAALHPPLLPAHRAVLQHIPPRLLPPRHPSRARCPRA